MAFNIPEKQWVRVQESTSDIVYCGYFDNVTEKELVHIKVGFFKCNTLGRFQIRLHTNSNRDSIFAVSNIINFADIQETNFVGNIRFDFSNTLLVTNQRFHVTIVSYDYNRNADINYVGWLFDYPYPTNVSIGTSPNTYPIRMEIFAK